MTTPNVIHLANGKLTGETTSAAVEDIVSRACDANYSGGLVIHFHGGLVSYGDGMEVAAKLHPVYAKANAFPLFFVWESGLKETIGNNMEEIAKERLFQILWKRVASIVLRKFGQGDGQRAGSIVPMVSTAQTNTAIDQATLMGDLSGVRADDPSPPDSLMEINHIELMKLEAELKLDIPLKTELAAVSAGLRDAEDIQRDVRDRSVATVVASTRTLMDPQAVERYVDRPTGDTRGILSTARIIKGVVMIAARVIKRFIQKRDHGFHATVVEEILRELYIGNIGGEIWSMMKQDTEDCFKPDANVYGGTSFLTALGKACAAGKQPHKITLVGHSTGAVYIAHFLRTAQQLVPDRKFNVIFLAPASTFDLSGTMLKDQGGLIENFRMFAMTDANEKLDELVKAVYPHSLLYFVSGILEDPAGDTSIVGMNRYYDKARYASLGSPEADAFRDYVAGDPERVCWSTTEGSAAPGHRTMSLKHGDFDDDVETQNSMVQFIK